MFIEITFLLVVVTFTVAVWGVAIYVCGTAPRWHRRLVRWGLVSTLFILVSALGAYWVNGPAIGRFILVGLWAFVAAAVADHSRKIRAARSAFDLAVAPPDGQASPEAVAAMIEATAQVNNSMNVALGFASVAIAELRTSVALALLSTIRPLNPARAAWHAYLVGLCAVQDLDAARIREQVARAPRSTSFDPYLALLLAYAQLIEDDHAAALAARPTTPVPALRESWACITAHALAAGDAIDEARAALRALEPHTLARVASGRLPASRIARTLLAGERPYR